VLLLPARSALKHLADWYGHRKLNTSPASLDEKETLAKPLCIPKVKKIDLHFPLGLEVSARNLKGVTIKDALDAIYKQFKKKVCHANPAVAACLLLPVLHLGPQACSLSDHSRVLMLICPGRR
jgi:hypothetical protein